jgi:DNA polymerase III epsilon subunit-like protein
MNKNMLDEEFQVQCLEYFDGVQSHRYGLKHMMDFYQLDFHGHHDALNDAKACAMITYNKNMLDEEFQVQCLEYFDGVHSYQMQHYVQRLEVDRNLSYFGQSE